jgi:hypothetical protein
MGVAEDVEIDVRGPFELREGDTFILCSDGLHGVVKEQELQDIATGTIEEAADEFLRRALERGAPDNVTVIVARVEVTDEPPPPHPEFSDAHFEDTQPLDTLESELLDETVKTTQKLVAVTPEELREDLKTTDKIAIVTGDDTLPMSPPLPRISAAPPVEKKTKARRFRAGWVVVLVVVLALGAVGAWYFWNQQQAITAPR